MFGRVLMKIREKRSQQFYNKALWKQIHMKTFVPESFFLIKLLVLPFSLIKMKTKVQEFSYEFCEIFLKLLFQIRRSFFYLFHPRIVILM